MLDFFVLLCYNVIQLLKGGFYNMDSSVNKDKEITAEIFGYARISVDIEKEEDKKPKRVKAQY